MSAMKTVDKPWGREIWFAVHHQYAGKILEVEKGHRLSHQYHKVKHETIYVLDGLVKVTHEGTDKVLKPGEAIEIKPGEKHRITAIEKSKLVEASTAHLDDVIRLEDDYGR